MQEVIMTVPSGVLEIHRVVPGGAGSDVPALEARLAARLEWIEGVPCLTAADGGEPVWVNGQVLKPHTPYFLQAGDTVQYAELRFVWRDSEEAKSFAWPLPTAVPVPDPASAVTPPDPGLHSGPALWVTASSRYWEFPLQGESLTIGRGAENGLRIEEKGVSRRHARLEAVQGGYRIIDLGSLNGIRYQGGRVKERFLQDGDVIWLAAGVSLEYRVGSREPVLAARSDSPGHEPAATLIIPGKPAGEGTPDQQLAATVTTGSGAIPGKTSGPGPAETLVVPPGKKPDSLEAGELPRTEVLSTPAVTASGKGNLEAVLPESPVAGVRGQEPADEQLAATVTTGSPDQTLSLREGSSPAAVQQQVETAAPGTRRQEASSQEADSAQTQLLTRPVMAPEAGGQGESEARTIHLTAQASEEPATLAVAEPPPVEAAPDSPSSGLAQLPHLVIHLPDRTWEAPLAGDRLAIGRTDENEIVIDNSSISRRHALIERQGDGFIMRDARSTNGVWLGDRRIESHPLQDGDTLRIGRARLVYKAGFSLDDLTLAGPPGDGRSARRPVVIVPGIMGSELWLGSERLWPNPLHLLAHPEMANYPGDPRVEARALVSEVVLVPGFIKLEQYNRLGDYLESGLQYTRGVDLLEFPYDWRQDVRQSARKLGQAIESWEQQGPVTIVAHSMGCLVSRYYVEVLGGRERVERLILLGGPHYGAPKTLATLLNGPDLLPFGLGSQRLRDLIATFPAMYQLLPSYACVVDQEGRRVNPLVDDSWLPEAQRPMLRFARGFRRELGPRSTVPAVSIFGYGQKTFTQIKIRRGREGGWAAVEFREEPGGDLTVPAASAVLQRSEIHPVPQAHGSLYVDNDVKMRLKLELTRTTTWQRR
jgi:pSer/pThr/pTyr-binding forkhead associated (FHA) protein/pimeloyl-ACP methyl ester carboxylesterase